MHDRLYLIEWLGTNGSAVMAFVGTRGAILLARRYRIVTLVPLV
jgi:hypothetical protein